jgi:hypothetical protein
MSGLDDFYTEDELVRLVKEKTGKGTTRTLRKWRQLRRGPPWAYLGRIVIYPKPDFGSWLHDQVRRSPVRRKRA